MEKGLKAIIKEEIERFMNEKVFKKDFEYLQPFKYMGKIKNLEKDCYYFVLSHKGNDLIASLSKNKKGWFFSLHYDGNQVENDAKVKWGPYNSYEEMKKEVNPKLKNNMQFSTGNLKNSKRDAENDDILFRIRKLDKIGDKILSLKEGNLEDLKKLYKNYLKIKALNLTDIQFVDKLREIYNHNVTGITNVLNKIPQVDYYKKLEKFQGE